MWKEKGRGQHNPFPIVFLRLLLQEIILTGWHAFRLHFLTGNIKHISFFLPHKA